MSIDFKNLDKDGEDFELFCRDLLESIGIDIVEGPSRGPDQKKDFIISVSNSNAIGLSSRTTYLVQCKHKAHSGKSVLESDIGDFRSACENHKVDGYFLMTSTIPSTTVRTNLEGARDRGHVSTMIWDKKDIEKALEKSSKRDFLINSYRLKNELELTVDIAERVLLNENHLPFDFVEKNIESESVNFEFEFKEVTNDLNEIIHKIHFICISTAISKEKFEELKIRFDDSQEVYFITYNTDNKDLISTNSLIKLIQSYRDETYQSIMWNCFNFIPTNPGKIRLLESSISKIPYPIADITKHNLHQILSLDIKTEDDFFLKLEALNTCIKLNLREFSPIFLSMVSSYKPGQLLDVGQTIYLATLIQGLTKMEQHGFAADISKLIESSNCLSYKASLIVFFIDLGIKDALGNVEKFFNENVDEELPATNHGIYYNNEKVRIIPNLAKLKVKNLKERYDKT